MKLAYHAYNREGREIRDVIEAATRDEATAQLRRDGLFVMEVHEPSAGAASPDRQRRTRMGGGARLRNLSLFTRQLYVLSSTGTPLAEALAALERQTRDANWKQVIADLRHRVEEGASLAEAMQDHPQCFDAVYRSLVASGESSGRFESMLDRLALLVRRQHQVRNAIQGALVYPALLLAVSIVVLVLLIVFVLPRFAELFETLSLPLPASTQAMLIVSEFLRQYWWIALLTLAAAGWASHTWLGTQKGREFMDTLMIRTPGLRPITQGFITARIARLLGTLLENHVSLLDALDLTRQAAVNVHYRKLIDKAEDAVTRGEPISLAFRDASLISPSVYEALRSGETTGQIGPLLLNIADFLDEDNEVVLRSLTSILEPIILIVLGLFVGLVALSMFLPLFDLTASIGG